MTSRPKHHNVMLNGDKVTKVLKVDKTFFQGNGQTQGLEIWTCLSSELSPDLSRSQQHAPTTHVNSGAAGLRPPPLFRHKQQD